MARTIGWRDWFETLWPVAIAIGIIAIIVTCSGCNTMEQIQETPIDFWVSLELLLLAVWDDVVSVVDLIL